MKRIMCLLLAALMLVPCLCGCGTKKETAVVRLNEVTHSVFYAPQYVAMELGFFEEEGLKIELVNGGGADKVMTAVVSGQSDIGLAGPESCIYIHNQGKDNLPIVFGQLTKRDGSFLVGRTDEDFSWDDLKGKTIIGGRKGGVPEMTLEYVMKKNGVIPGKDATVDTSIQFNMMAGAFTGGQGDYVTLFEPTASQVEAAKEGYILCSVGMESGEIPYTAYFATEDYLQEHADAVAAFSRAMVRALQWVDTHTDAEVASAIAPQFPDTDVELLTAVTARHRAIDAWNMEFSMKESALEALEIVMTEAGELTREQWVDFEKMVNNSFAQAACDK